MMPEKLKRIKVSSAQDMHSWLARNTDHTGQVMLITCNRISPTKHIPGEIVRGALADHGWTCARSYTLSGNLNGYVISRD